MNKQAGYHVNRKLSDCAGAPAEPSGVVSGEFVTETFEYDGGRQVTVYVPPDPPEAIVFAGDGQRISKWGRLGLCRARFRAHTLSLAQRSRSSSRTQGGGRTRCAMQVRMSSCMSELDRTAAHSGEKSSR